MEKVNRESIHDDFIEVTKWPNSDGYDIVLNDNQKDRKELMELIRLIKDTNPFLEI